MRQDVQFEQDACNKWCHLHETTPALSVLSDAEYIGCRLFSLAEANRRPERELTQFRFLAIGKNDGESKFMPGYLIRM